MARSSWVATELAKRVGGWNGLDADLKQAEAKEFHGECSPL